MTSLVGYSSKFVAATQTFQCGTLKPEDTVPHLAQAMPSPQTVQTALQVLSVLTTALDFSSLAAQWNTGKFFSCGILTGKSVIDTSYTVLKLLNL